MTQTAVRETAAPTVEQVDNHLIIRFNPGVEMTDDLFAEFCSMNDDLRIELTADGTIEIMPPTFGLTGNRNSNLTTQLGNWTLSDDTGVAFDSSAGFRLPNNALRAPDASWISRSRYDALTDEEKTVSLPYAPTLWLNYAPAPTGSASCKPKWKNTSPTARESAGCSTPCNAKRTSIAPTRSRKF